MLLSPRQGMAVKTIRFSSRMDTTDTSKPDDFGATPQQRAK